MSLSKLFGSDKNLRTAPPRGPKWTMAELAPRAHFINCHRAHDASEYYGQPPRREEFPTAHSAKLLPGKGPDMHPRAKNLPRAVTIIATAENGKLLHLRRLRSR